MLKQNKSKGHSGTRFETVRPVEKLNFSDDRTQNRRPNPQTTQDIKN